MNIDQRAKLIRDALKYAEKKHAGQTRKLSGSPYIHHPIMVSYIAANYKKSKSQHILTAAAILHDTIEDTDATPEDIAKLFGSDVAKLVFELTDNVDEINRIGKVNYQKVKWPGLSSYGLYLKLCDRLANVSDNPSDKYKEDTKTILNYLTKKRKLSDSHKAVIKEIRIQIK